MSFCSVPRRRRRDPDAPPSHVNAHSTAAGLVIVGRADLAQRDAVEQNAHIAQAADRRRTCRTRPTLAARRCRSPSASAGQMQPTAPCCPVRAGSDSAFVSSAVPNPANMRMVHGRAVAGRVDAARERVLARQPGSARSPARRYRAACKRAPPASADGGEALGAPAGDGRRGASSFPAILRA